MNPLCIYHGACDDGFAAAWCVRRAMGDGAVDFHPGVYGVAPPDVLDRDVILVDFSYKRPVLEALASRANSVLILDHHKTAQKDLAFLQPPHRRPPPAFDRWRLEAWRYDSGGHQDGDRYDGDRLGRVAALFDMERSGAAMAWDYFVGGERPPFIEYVQDRDLWLKKLPRGDEFTIALRSYPQDFAVWDGLVENMSNLFEEGVAIQRYYRCRVEEIKKTAYRSWICSHPVMVANAPYFAASEVAGELAEAEPDAAFGACYFEVRRGVYQYSLRSRGEMDVSEIARQFGGGGHKNAAGFTVSKIVHEGLHA